ncbi:deaminase [Aeromicrobium sp. Root495]|uniref:dihydrofolate reductase family protein n=1 Tax=Aeromicrobium sp. Root495 TaxID=1736550 RepID=UPI0006F33E44|nr:dihydrofolate reductase family protein [Aeromicrobium sp. Root495]KQY60357.1 deaminase [Aeromicrobium sp. Root495]
MATVYYTASTLDGFLATPEHSLDWLFAVEHEPGLEADMAAFTDSVGALVMGSSTYRWVYEHDDLAARPEQWREWYGERPAWVLTHREQPVVEGADIRFTQAPVARVHAEATAAAGERDVWVLGGGEVVGQLADEGLLDRLVVTIAPVTLGAGAPLLPRVLESDRLTLTHVQRAGQLVSLTYDVGPLPR